MRQRTDDRQRAQPSLLPGVPPEPITRATTAPIEDPAWGPPPPATPPQVRQHVTDVLILSPLHGAEFQAASESATQQELEYCLKQKSLKQGRRSAIKALLKLFGPQPPAATATINSLTLQRDRVGGISFTLALGEATEAELTEAIATTTGDRKQAIEGALSDRFPPAVTPAPPSANREEITHALDCAELEGEEFLGALEEATAKEVEECWIRAESGTDRKRALEAAMARKYQMPSWITTTLILDKVGGHAFSQAIVQATRGDLEHCLRVSKPGPRRAAVEQALKELDAPAPVAAPQFETIAGAWLPSSQRDKQITEIIGIVQQQIKVTALAENPPRPGDQVMIGGRVAIVTAVECSKLRATVNYSNGDGGSVPFGLIDRIERHKDTPLWAASPPAPKRELIRFELVGSEPQTGSGKCSPSAEVLGSADPSWSTEEGEALYFDYLLDQGLDRRAAMRLIADLGDYLDREERRDVEPETLHVGDRVYLYGNLRPGKVTRIHQPGNDRPWDISIAWDDGQQNGKAQRQERLLTDYPKLRPRNLRTPKPEELKKGDRVYYCKTFEPGTVRRVWHLYPGHGDIYEVSVSWDHGRDSGRINVNWLLIKSKADSTPPEKLKPLPKVAKPKQPEAQLETSAAHSDRIAKQAEYHNRLKRIGLESEAAANLDDRIATAERELAALNGKPIAPTGWLLETYKAKGKYHYLRWAIPTNSGKYRNKHIPRNQEAMAQESASNRIKLRRIEGELEYLRRERDNDQNH